MQIDYTKVPTDNLYKLMAVGGVVLLVASFYFMFQYEHQVRQLQLEAKVEEAALQKEWEFLNTTFYDKNGSRSEQQVDWAMVDRLANFARRSETHKARMAALESVQEADAKKNGMMWWLAILGAVGGALMTFGFGLWYFRLQRHQDKLLLFELRKAEREAASEPA